MYEVRLLSMNPCIPALLSYILPTDAVSEIQSGRSVYVREGSLLNVTCLTRGQLTLATGIYWYRGTHLLNTSGRGGISINSDKVTGRQAQHQISHRGQNLSSTPLTPIRHFGPHFWHHFYDGEQ